MRIGPWINLFLFFTNWCVLFTLFTALIGIYLASNDKMTIKKAINLHALHHVSYTLTLFMTPVVVIMYWGIVH
jgi:hypothetical protein